MREAGRIVAETLLLLQEAVRPGITTAELDALAERHIRRRGATPSFKGYRGFPATICVAVNDEVVHGIPGPRVLHEGDIISIDIGARYRGFHGDATITVPVGRISPEAERLLRDGIAAADPILIDTRKNVILGRGGFSFKNEALDLRIRADGKRFSLFSGQSPVGVGGYFARPSI
ncbi:MAG: hypothetical protein C4321_06470, partial [Chloroflexota bacterium]